MNKFALIISLLVFFSSCNNTPASEEVTKPASSVIDFNKYPEALQKIFAKHGGLETWQKMNGMSYEIVKEEGNEKQIIDLKNRRERIEAANFTTGYDGKDFWLEADSSYQGNPVFYHNLMFYFYAMPFVLADDGILYSETEPMEYEGKSYPGIRISYEDGVGVSSKDEYFIHYDPITFEMAWLGYTVTYSTNEVSEKISWIRYDDWTIYNGLLLPSSMNWFKSKEGKLLEPKRRRAFVNVVVSEKPFEDAVFEKTEKAVVVE